MYNIAVFLGELQLDSQRKVINGITEGIRAAGNNLYVYSITLSIDEAYNKGEYVIAEQDDFSVYDGFILYAESIYSVAVRNALIRKVCSTGKPVVSIDCVINGVINISSNNDKSMRMLSKHVLDDHKVDVINYIGGPEDSLDAIVRRDALSDEMKKRGYPMNKKRYFVGDYYARSGRKAVEYYEQNGVLDADAYICANDQMALGVYYALTERGIRIPEDAIITGYDDIFEAANHYPRITSVARYENEIGKVAYESLIKAIEGQEHETNIEIDSEIVCAESCGCSCGRPDSNQSIINQYVEKSLRNTRHAELISDFSADNTDITDFDELLNRLQYYIQGFGADAYAACFFEEYNNTDNIKLGLFCEDDKHHRIANFSIEDKTKVFTRNEGGNVYVINSIHFGERCYGFTVIRNSQMPFQSEFYRIFAINLGNSIEHINNYTKMQEMIKTLDEMWVFDPMTHLYNRAGFFKFADEMMVEAKYKRQNLFLIFLDLDGLKKVNDLYGHEYGDKLICEMADILRKCRDKEELLMRYGGDEFVIFGSGYDEEFVKSYVERIRKAMKEFNERENRKYTIEASIGYSEIAYDDTRTLSGLIESADQRMYEEKRLKHSRENG